MGRWGEGRAESKLRLKRVLNLENPSFSSVIKRRLCGYTWVIILHRERWGGGTKLIYKVTY